MTGVWLFRGRSSIVTEAELDRIKTEMTEAQVSAILGGPNKNRRRDRYFEWVYAKCECFDDDPLVIVFDETGRVIGYHGYASF